jgi:hypothetical protein
MAVPNLTVFLVEPHAEVCHGVTRNASESEFYSPGMQGQASIMFRGGLQNVQALKEI